MAKDKSKEIVSFNKELMDFDLQDLTIEELDRRLELAVANLFITANLSCGTDCGSFCGTFTCTSNCGAHFAKLLEE